MIRKSLLSLVVLLYCIWGFKQFNHNTFKEGEIQLFANQCDDDFNSLLSKAISQAQSSIFLSIYSLQDETILSLLEEKAAKGLKITLSTDPQMGKKMPPVQGVSITANPTSGLMHQKIVVIDEKKIVIGSANFTVDSLHLDANLIATWIDEKMAQSIVKMEPYKNDTIEFWPLPKAKEESFDRLLTVLNEAKKSIQVAMFTWTNSALTNAIIEAKNRGVKVEVILDKKSAEGTSKEAREALLKENIPLYLSLGRGTLHHKLAIIDENILVFGSANWTKAAFSKNDESLLIINPLTQKQKGKLKELWHACKSDSMKLKIKKSVVDLRSEPKEVESKEDRLTQLLYNETVTLQSWHLDWLYVNALEQEHFSDRWHPYQGWVHESEVERLEKPLALTHVVCKPWSHHLMLNIPLSFGTWVQEQEAPPQDVRPISKTIDRKTLISDAERCLTIPYLWGGRASGGMDCSSLIDLLFRAQGKSIPRDAHPQQLKCKKIEKHQLQPGDLVYLNRLDNPGKTTHVLLYKDPQTCIEAPSTGHFVQTIPMNLEEKIRLRDVDYLPILGTFVL